MTVTYTISPEQLKTVSKRSFKSAIKQKQGEVPTNRHTGTLVPVLKKILHND